MFWRAIARRRAVRARGRAGVPWRAAVSGRSGARASRTGPDRCDWPGGHSGLVSSRIGSAPTRSGGIPRTRAKTSWAGTAHGASGASSVRAAVSCQII